jgi:hypothetical protein
MTSSQDRWVHPADGDDPRDIDRETSDAEAMADREATRQVSHDQDVEGASGLTSDKPGIDPSNPHHPDQGGTPTTD